MQGIRYVVVFEGGPEGCAACWLGYYALLQPQLALVAETSLVWHTWDRSLINQLRLGQFQPGPALDKLLAQAYHEVLITARVYRYRSR